MLAPGDPRGALADRLSSLEGDTCALDNFSSLSSIHKTRPQRVKTTAGDAYFGLQDSQNMQSQIEATMHAHKT